MTLAAFDKMDTGSLAPDASAPLIARGNKQNSLLSTILIYMVTHDTRRSLTLQGTCTLSFILYISNLSVGIISMGRLLHRLMAHC